jgi:hypothetical protein
MTRSLLVLSSIRMTTGLSAAPRARGTRSCLLALSPADSGAQLQPEILLRDLRALAQALDRRSGKPIAFAERRQVDQFGGMALTTTEVGQARS